MDNYMSVINDSYKWFIKYFKREKTDDSFWHDAVEESSQILRKNSGCRYAKNMLLCIMNELSNVKDWGDNKTDEKVYYNIFLDCSKVIKAIPSGFEKCNVMATKLCGKYNNLELATKMIEATLEEAADKEEVKEHE